MSDKIRLGDIVDVEVTSSEPFVVDVRGIRAPFQPAVHETFEVGDSTMALVDDLFVANGEVGIETTRAGGDFVRALLNHFVPAVRLGKSHIMRIARIEGVRSKIAVRANGPEPQDDPVRVCIGDEGELIRPVVAALNGETIDLVPFNPEAVRFVCSAIAPIQVRKVVVDEEGHRMELVVPDEHADEIHAHDYAQVRLASSLTGWGLNVVTETQQHEMRAALRDKLLGFPGVSDDVVDALFAKGFTSLEFVARTRAEILVEDVGISEQAAQSIIAAARARLEPTPS